MSTNNICFLQKNKNSTEGGVIPAWGQGSWDSINTSLEHKIDVKVTSTRCVMSEDVEEKHYARFEGANNYSWQIDYSAAAGHIPEFYSGSHTWCTDTDKLVLH